MRSLSLFILLLSASWLFPNTSLSQQQRALGVGFTRDTFYFGDFDTVAWASVSPTDSCFWTDTTKLNFSCGIGTTIVIDSAHAIAVRKIDWHGTVFTYADADVMLGCGRQTLLGDAYVTAVDRADVKSPENNEPVLALLSPQDPFVRMRITSSQGIDAEIRLFNLLGYLVYRGQYHLTSGTNEIDLDTRGLPPGCYWYRVHGGEWERNGKVVKLDR